MGKERQRGALIVQGKVKWKGEEFKDDLRYHQVESFSGRLLTCQLLS